MTSYSQHCALGRFKYLSSRAAGAGLLSCASVYNLPLNVPMNGNVLDRPQIGLEDHAAMDGF